MLVISVASNSLTQNMFGRLNNSFGNEERPGAAFKMDTPLNSSKALIVAGIGVSS